MGLTAREEWNKIASVKGDDDLEKHIMGVAYNNILDRNLALDAGFKSTPDFITAMLKEAAQAPPTLEGLKVRELSVGVLSTYGVAARTFSAAEFAKYGHTALYLLLRYRKAAKLTESVPLDQLRIVDDAHELS